MEREAWRAVADRLDAAIESVASRPEECARSPGRDFARNRKLGLGNLLRLIVTMGSDALGMELLRAWGMDADAPTVGALCQQWAKLNDAAMPMLHAEFLSAFEPVATAGRYWLLACDGTGLAMAPDASDAETRLPPARGHAGRNEAHLTCAFDVARGVFVDMVAQGGRGQDEPGAAGALVDRCRPPAGLEALWLMDRNFFCLNLLWHMARAGAHFVCRLTDARARGLLSHWLGEAGASIGCVGSADAEVDVCVVRSASAARSRPGEPWLYRTYQASRRFDGLAPGEGGECWLRVRVVRLATPAGVINLATDLPGDEWPPGRLAGLYLLRWSIERAFDELKHVAGLECPHVRTLRRVTQEAWGRLTLHAAGALAAACAAGPGREGRATDRTVALKVAMACMRGACADLAAVCARRTQAVRRGRRFKRRKRPRRPPAFTRRH